MSAVAVNAPVPDASRYSEKTETFGSEPAPEVAISVSAL